ncbi:MAG: PD-(D/E)XK nuclease family protein [Lachnospiraceae bacterium]|nr:PD-(D/E)XK nuclease family protein [Lachnospiraceae bacterium]
MVTYKQIEELITDFKFQELKNRQEKTNVFTIVGQTHTEHWHSSFISWLLDAHSSLRLGYFPLERLLIMYMMKNPDCGFTLRDIYSWNLDEVRFYTEKDASYQGKKRSIDVYGESRELIIVIENKVNAKENYNNSEYGQTMDYCEYVEIHKSPEQRALYFFITADQNQTASSNKYVQISYQEMFDNIISKCIEHPQVSQDGKYLLEQYAANLRETIRNSNTPMALVNINLCKEIYDEYAEILDDIFMMVEGTMDIKNTAEPGCMAYEHYQSVFDEIYLSVEEKYGKTPNAKLQRQVMNFTDLYKRGAVKPGMRFCMKYDGEFYYARIVLSDDKKNCYLQVLDEKQEPFVEPGTNRVLGIYENSSSAGVDVINLRREKKGISERVKTLRGNTYWVNDEGLSIKELMDKY